MAIVPVKGREIEEGVDRLRTLVYPHFPEVLDVEWHRSVWRWLETHPLAGEEMHRWAATANGEVVGHLAAFPQRYRVGGRRVVAHTPTDYQALPEYGFQAYALMRKFFSTAENCVACDMVPAVIQVETRMGAETAGSLQYAAKLLDVSRLPVPRLPGPLERYLEVEDDPAPARGYGGDSRHGAPAPPPVRKRLPIPKPVRTLLNRGLQAADGALGSLSGTGLEVEEVREFDESFDELFERVAAAVPCVPEKDAAFLRWRYGPGSPQHGVTVLGVRDGERLLGYAVLRVTSEGQHGFRDAFIMDLTTVPGRGDVARALLREAVGFFRREGTPIIRYRFLRSPTAPQPEDLLRMGFFNRNDRGNTLLVKFTDEMLHEEAGDTARWSYNIGDGEATFWLT